MVDRDQHPTRENEIRRAVFGQVDLQTAELEIDSSIYDGFAAAIMVKGQPRTIALTREYGDAVQLMALIERGRSAQPEASEAGAAAGEGPQPVRGEIRVIDGNRCRFIERELEGDKWEVIGPALSDSAREDAQPVAWKFRHVGQRRVGVTMDRKEAEQKAASGWEVEPLGPITHPAPDAMRDDHDAVTRTLAALIDPAIDHKLAKQRLMTMRRRAALQAGAK